MNNATEIMGLLHSYYNKETAKVSSGEVDMRNHFSSCSMDKVILLGVASPIPKGWKKTGPRQLIWLASHSQYMPVEWRGYELLFDEVVFHDTEADKDCMPNSPPSLWVPTLSYNNGSIPGWNNKRIFLSCRPETHRNMLRLCVPE